MKQFLHQTRGFAAAMLILGSAAASHSATVTTLGGGPTPGNFSKAGFRNGNTLMQAKFNQPFGVAVLDDGNLVIADKHNRKLREIVLPGDTELSYTTTFASKVPLPAAVTVDAAGNVYAANERGTVTVYDATGALLNTYAGFGKLTGIAVDSTGIIYVSAVGGAITSIAPDGSSDLLLGGFARPTGLALIDDSTLAVSDAGVHGVYTVDILTRQATLYAGGHGAGFADGSADSAQFNTPWGLATGPGGTLVVADRLNHRVRLIRPNRAVSTIYGASRSSWDRSYAGWRDGETTTAQGREPVGVAVAPDGNIYVTEAFWHTIREVTGAFTITNTPSDTNGTNVATGPNTVSFGFTSGEASSEFVGAAGQTFFAPVTLTVSPNTKIYSFQMSLSATGETGVALNPLSSSFSSMVQQLETVIGNVYTNEQGIRVTNYTAVYIPINPNYTFQNTAIDLLGVGWIARKETTNVYNTFAQDLIKYSIAKDTLFGSSQGSRVVLGAYGFQIPSTASLSDTFRITLGGASGTSDGVSQAVPLDIPTGGSLGGGSLNTIKRVTLASKGYVVGDGTPFRWYNAGDFGEGLLGNSDVMEVFQTAVYNVNFRTDMHSSDLFNALDSSDGTVATNTLKLGDDLSINSVTNWDNELNVDDVWVTFRRSLDPSLKWYSRYWSNGVRQVVEVPNRLSGAFGSSTPAPVAASSPVARPTLDVVVSDSLVSAGSEVQIPVRVKISPGYLLRVMMMNVTVEPLDGSPALTDAIQVQMSPAFQSPELTGSTGAGNYSAAWLDASISGLSGESILAFLTVKIPSTAGARSGYRIKFDHFSASPNGMALFDSHVNNALLLLSDRTASTWADGISDEWRLRYWGSISAPGSDPNSDPDGDGATNAAEFQNGTDPTDSTSF